MQPLTVDTAEDGKQMDLDCEHSGIKRIMEEVNRHSRALQKQIDLTE
jgi:large subunit ribosomal protein L53